MQTDVAITDHRISLLLDLMDYLQSIKSINVELAGERCKLLDMITRVCDHYLLVICETHGSQPLN